MLRRKNRRRPATETTARRRIPWRRIAIGGGGVASAAGIYLMAAWLLNRPIETIVINGAFQRVSSIQLQAMLEPATRTGFLNVDMGQVRGELMALPWVARADVRRKWPGTLEVSITEERPVACWGDRGLLNANGRLFIANADHLPPELPRLKGPEGTERQVTELFFRIQEQLEHRGLAAVGMTLDNRGSWTLRMSSGMEVRLGAQAVEERVTRFFRVFDRVVGPVSGDVDYVDMRYTNGFAIGWKNRGAVQAAAADGPEPNA